jgi:hypothetical protein
MCGLWQMKARAADEVLFSVFPDPLNQSLERVLCRWLELASVADGSMRGNQKAVCLRASMAKLSLGKCDNLNAFAVVHSAGMASVADESMRGKRKAVYLHVATDE